MNNEENRPHLTPSNTGTTNIYKSIEDGSIDLPVLGLREMPEYKTDWLEDALVRTLDVVYVTRAYKTKHGAGRFPEQDDRIKDMYGLYDRTNSPNAYQGTLRYGRLDMGKMRKRVCKDFDALKSGLSKTGIKLSASLAITHLDQTNGKLLTTTADRYYTDILSDDWFGGDTTYYCFGEKASDVFRHTLK